MEVLVIFVGFDLQNKVCAYLEFSEKCEKFDKTDKLFKDANLFAIIAQACILVHLSFGRLEPKFLTAGLNFNFKDTFDIIKPWKE